MHKLAALAVFFVLLPLSSQSQVVLFEENFDACSLPNGWEVTSVGNQNSVWYLSDAIQNTNNQGQSMNGSCFLFIDDDATGDQTPSYVLDFVSPVFDASQYPTIELSVDVHYRDWDQGNESFEVLLTDGVTETLIRRYDAYRSTGSNLYDFETLVFDLSLLSNAANVRLIFRYNDAAGYNWWAGVDNISVVGKGQGTNIIVEPFSACSKPAGWETAVVAGVDDWKFGLITEGAALSNGNSMDGSCFAYFDDDFLGPNTPFSMVRLLSPWFDGSQFGSFTLDYDLIVRYHSERVSVFVQNIDGDEYLVSETNENEGGPYFSDFVHKTQDISPFRSKQMRVIFQYDDGQDWAWWAGLDNVKISGFGTAHDLCVNATPLQTGAACLPGDNTTALLDGPADACVPKSVGGLWYAWTADFTGNARLETRAEYNEVVSIFTGDCANPQPLLCHNRDEHGFTSETTYFQATMGTPYWIRVSGQKGGFGKSRGNLCVGINQHLIALIKPTNDDCINAFPLIIDGNCPNSVNLYAHSSTNRPSYNDLARHDVWFNFTAPALGPNEVLEIQSNANFSDIITLYSGDCASLEEVVTNHKGRLLTLQNVTPGTQYWVQIAGTFATIEGSLCPTIRRKNQDAPNNNLCTDAINIQVGGACTSGSNVGASNSGYVPPCVVSVENDIWYQFVAPSSGSVRINTGADFPHVLAVWEGDCAQLTPLLCARNPLRCAGYVTLGSLSPGSVYRVQIASELAAAGPISGHICLHITDGSMDAPFEALSLQVDEKCVASNITQLQISAQGGIQPYTFEGNMATQLLNTGETYLVVVTDALGCEKSLMGYAEDCEALACNLNGALAVLQPNCANANNGGLSALIMGGVAPYRYAWSNGASTAELTGLPAGTYTATVTDAVDCEVVMNADLSAPPVITAIPTSIIQPNQGQSNGAIFVDVAGGNGVFNFAWIQNGIPLVNSEDLTSAPDGDYTLVVTDGNGCSASFDFTLTETVGNQTVATKFYTEIFPNPAVEKAWLAVSFPQKQTLYLSLTDAAGRALHTWTVREVTEQNIPIDLKNLPAGAYNLHIRTETSVMVESIIVVGSGSR